MCQRGGNPRLKIAALESSDIEYTQAMESNSTEHRLITEFDVCVGHSNM